MNKIEKGSVNVYADLGLADSEEMRVKAQLATKIGEIIKQRRLTQVQAAELLGMPQPRLSNMLPQGGIEDHDMVREGHVQDQTVVLACEYSVLYATFVPGRRAPAL